MCLHIASPHCIWCLLHLLHTIFRRAGKMVFCWPAYHAAASWLASPLYCCRQQSFLCPVKGSCQIQVLCIHILHVVVTAHIFPGFSMSSRLKYFMVYLLPQYLDSCPVVIPGCSMTSCWTCLIGCEANTYIWSQSLPAWVVLCILSHRYFSFGVWRFLVYQQGFWIPSLLSLLLHLSL